MEPAGQHTVRQHNLRLVLGELAQAPGSKADLAARTGLTKATVASLVDLLIEQQVLDEGQPERSGPGRPSRPLAFHPDLPVAVGIEINVDNLAVCLMDLGGNVQATRQVTVDNRGRTPATVFRRAARLASEALVQVDRTPIGLALALPAVISPDGLVRRAPNLPRLNGQDAAALLRNSLIAADIPLADELDLTIENEANLGALAGLRSDPGLGEDFVYVSSEVGIGAGIVLNGQIFRGVNGFAGELGHVVVERHGRRCGCGGLGCLEQYAGLEALLRAARQPDVPAFEAALSQADARATHALAEAAEALGVGLASFLNVVDVPVIALGGIYGRLLEHCEAPLARQLSRRALSWKTPAEPTTRPIGEVTAEGPDGGQSLDVVGRLRAAPLGTEAAVRGAAGLVVDRALQRPQTIRGARKA